MLYDFIIICTYVHIRLHHQGHSEQPQREHHQEDHHLDKQQTHLHVDQLQDHHHVDQLQDQRQNNNIFIISDGHLKPIEEGKQIECILVEGGKILIGLLSKLLSTGNKKVFCYKCANVESKVD